MMLGFDFVIRGCVCNAGMGRCWPAVSFVVKFLLIGPIGALLHIVILVLKIIFDMWIHYTWKQGDLNCPFDPVTRPSSRVRVPAPQGTKGEKKRNKRDRTPDTVSMDEDEGNDYFTISRLPSLEADNVAESFDIPNRESLEIITPANFPKLLQEINDQRGVQRKFDEINNGEEVMLCDDDTGRALSGVYSNLPIRVCFVVYWWIQLWRFASFYNTERRKPTSNRIPKR